MLDTNPVVSAVCKEPEGTTVRYVYPMKLSRENLWTFWNKAKKFRTVFTQEVTQDFHKFCEMFLSQEGDSVRSHGLFWVVDDFVGIFYITHITEVEATVHYTFFDRRHFGRDELTKEMLRYVFRKYGFWRLNVEIPLHASKNTFGFVAALGFRKEGRKRKIAEYKGERFDVLTFGLLREEILWEWDPSIKSKAEDQLPDSPMISSDSFETDSIPEASVEPLQCSDSTEPIPSELQEELQES